MPGSSQSLAARHSRLTPQAFPQVSYRDSATRRDQLYRSSRATAPPKRLHEVDEDSSSEPDDDSREHSMTLGVLGEQCSSLEERRALATCLRGIAASFQQFVERQVLLAVALPCMIIRR